MAEPCSPFLKGCTGFEIRSMLTMEASSYSSPMVRTWCSCFLTALFLIFKVSGQGKCPSVTYGGIFSRNLSELDAEAGFWAFGEPVESLAPWIFSLAIKA